MRSCPFCQGSLTADATACPHCGLGLAAPAAPTPGTQTNGAVPVFRATVGHGATHGGYEPRGLWPAVRAWYNGTPAIGERVEGTIISTPQLTPVARPAAGPLALIALLLGLAMLPVLLIVLLPLWALLYLGGRLMGPVAWLAVPLLAGSRRAGQTGNVVCSFRIEDSGAQTEVRLRGNHVGLALGDEVAVIGARRRGVLHAWRVQDRTTGQRFLSPGVGAAVIAGGVLLLLLMAAAQ